jgi:hypothetical protein
MSDKRLRKVPFWMYINPVWALHRQRAADFLDAVHRFHELPDRAMRERAIEISSEVASWGTNSPIERILGESGHDVRQILEDLGLKTDRS